MSKTQTKPKVTSATKVPEFAIISGAIYRAAAINAVDPIIYNEDGDYVVSVSLGGEARTLLFSEDDEAKKAHRLLVFLMTGTDLYTPKDEDAEAKHQEETGA